MIYTDVLSETEKKWMESQKNREKKKAPLKQMCAQRSYEKNKDSHILLCKKAKMKIPDTGSLKKKTQTKPLKFIYKKPHPLKYLLVNHP